MNNYLKILVVIACLAVPAVLMACGNSAGANVAISSNNSAVSTDSSTAAATPTPGTPSGGADELASSRELYKKNCAECHKDSGVGGKSVVDGKNINAKDLTTDKMVKRSDEKLYDDIAEGSPDDGMPAFKDKLRDSEINDIIKYIRTDLQHSSANSNTK